MILPTKYLSEDETLLGAGGILLESLKDPISLSELWENSKKVSNIGNYERFILTLDMLFIFDLIEFSGNKLKRKSNDSQNLCQQ